MNKKKMISFRPSDEDSRIIEETKIREGGTIRTLTDADVIRYGLSLIDKRTPNKLAGKKSIPKSIEQGTVHTEEVWAEIPIHIPHFEIIKGIPHVDNIPQAVAADSDFQLNEEQKMAGYKYINGELCDAQGYPVEQNDGDYVERNGEIYATDPGRTELKEIAKENSEKIVRSTDFGNVNEAMAAILAVSEKSDTLKKHAEPGMLTEQDGVDEGVNEDNFIN